MSRLETPEAMAERLATDGRYDGSIIDDDDGFAQVMADAIRERDAAVLARLDEIAEWYFNEAKMLEKLFALRAELRGDS